MAEDVPGVRDDSAVERPGEARPARTTEMPAPMPSRIADLRTQMECTTTSNILQEGHELREAAEQNLNVILDLGLDGRVRWASPTWPEVVGTDIESMKGRPIADILVEEKKVFTNATEALRQDDSGSKVIRFAVYLGPTSQLGQRPNRDTNKAEDDAQEAQEVSRQVLDMEAQGILVYDRSTGEESHVSVVRNI